MLHILAREPLSDITSNLISRLVKVIDINTRNNEGKTPLHLSVIHKNLETTQELIKHGAEVNLLNKYGHSALYYATLSGNIKMVQLLYNHQCNLSYKDKIGENVMHHAARNGHKGLVMFFIQKGVDINERNIWRLSPLETAIISGNTDIALVLIASGAKNFDKNDSKYEGYVCVLFKSIQMGDIKVTKALIDDLSINMVDNEQRTALHWAVEGNHPKIVKLIIKKHVDINKQDVDGYTALHLAIQNGYLEILDILIENAQVKSKNPQETQDLPKEQQIIDLDKLDYYKQTSFGDNILHILAAANLDAQIKMDVFYTLLKLNLKKLAVKANRDFRTPLHFAYQKFCRPLATALVNLGADIEEIDRFGKKPRDYCTLPDGGRIRIIKKESFTRRNVQSAVM